MLIIEEMSGLQKDGSGSLPDVITVPQPCPLCPFTFGTEAKQVKQNQLKNVGNQGTVRGVCVRACLCACVRMRAGVLAWPLAGFVCRPLSRAVQFNLLQIAEIPCSSFPPPQVDEIYHDESLGTNINIVLVRMIMVGYRQVSPTNQNSTRAEFIKGRKEVIERKASWFLS